METSQSPSYLKKNFLINIITSRGGGGRHAMYKALHSVIEQQQLPWDLSVTDMDEIAERLAEKKKDSECLQAIWNFWT